MEDGSLEIRKQDAVSKSHCQWRVQDFFLGGGGGGMLNNYLLIDTGGSGFSHATASILWLSFRIFNCYVFYIY